MMLWDELIFIGTLYVMYFSIFLFGYKIGCSTLGKEISADMSEAARVVKERLMSGTGSQDRIKVFMKKEPVSHQEQVIQELEKNARGVSKDET